MKLKFGALDIYKSPALCDGLKHSGSGTKMIVPGTDLCGKASLKALPEDVWFVAHFVGTAAGPGV